MNDTVMRTESVMMPLPAGSFRFKDETDRLIRLIEQKYLCHADVWKTFVDQFRFRTDTDLGWSCEFWGKMMRGAAMTCRYTQSETLFHVLTDTVKDMLSAQLPSGEWTTYKEENYFGGWDMWGRKYVLLGFEYYLDICRDKALAERIIRALCRHADAIIGRIGKEAGKIPVTAACSAWKGLPACSILEPFVKLYALTGEKRYLDFSAYIVESGGMADFDMFSTAYEDTLPPYRYPVQKAYEMMSCIEGLTEYYRATGDEKYKTAAVNFGKRVAETEHTVIGSAGCSGEQFDNASVGQLDGTYCSIMQETCVTVTWMKLCVKLLTLTGDALFADCLETSVYNAMPGAVNEYGIENILDGMPFDSYSPLYFGTRGRIAGGFRRMAGFNFGCCAAIGSAGTALMALSSAMKTKNGVCVNLYHNGAVRTLSPSGQTLTLSIETDYPKSGKIDIRIGLPSPETLDIILRVPAYSVRHTVCVNGARMDSSVGYNTLTRTWCDGDRITLCLDTRVRTWRRKDVENAPCYTALLAGPVVLARDARLGEPIDGIVSPAEDEEGFVDAVPCEITSFHTNLACRVKQRDGSYITVIDYASAGKTWEMDSALTVFMPEKECFVTEPARRVTLADAGLWGRDYYHTEDTGRVYGSPEKNDAAVWLLEKQSDGTYRIRSEKDGRYLVLDADAETPYARLAEDESTDNGLWECRRVWRDAYYLIHRKTRCVLHELMYSTGDFRLYAADETADKRFSFRMANYHFEVHLLTEITPAS